MLASSLQRPLLRGYLHLAAALLAPLAMVHLQFSAAGAAAHTGASIFGASLLLLYSFSAALHVGRWQGRARTVLRRVDHSMIFVLIAGTYTPFCLTVMGLAWGIPILAVTWSLAVTGIVLKAGPWELPRPLGVAFYLALGWLGVIALAEVSGHLTGAQIALIFCGGLLYSLGAVVYALRRPDPFPRVFGYHEVFHVLVIAGSAVHYVVLTAFVLPG